MTPFARLLLVILIVAPIAFVGGSYYNGENPLDNLKALVGVEQSVESSNDHSLETMSKSDLIDKIESLETRIVQLEEKLATLEAAN